MYNNFIVIGGYKILGYCTWKEDLKKSKHFNLMKGCAQSLNYFNAFLYIISHPNKNSVSFQALLSSRLSIQVNSFSRIGTKIWNEMPVS